MTDGTWCAICRGEVKSYDKLCTDCKITELINYILDYLRCNRDVEIDNFETRLNLEFEEGIYP